jgi:hypothetical protein
MNAQKNFRILYISAFIALAVAACATYPLAEPPTPATATASPTLTPALQPTETHPPTATIAPIGNLVVDENIILGPAKVNIFNLVEAQASPVREESAPAGKKYLLIELIIIELASGEELDSTRIVLETASGKQYRSTGVWGISVELGSFEADNAKVSSAGKEFNIFFEVDATESLDGLGLNYQ